MAADRSIFLMVLETWESQLEESRGSEYIELIVTKKDFWVCYALEAKTQMAISIFRDKVTKAMSLSKELVFKLS